MQKLVMAVKRLNKYDRRLFWILVFCILFVLAEACQNTSGKYNTGFKEIDFSYDSGGAEAYSFKIDSLGNLIYADGRWTGTFYTGKLNKLILATLDSFYSTIPFNKLDSSYSDTPTDLSSYQIAIISNDSIKMVFVYGYKEPKELRAFSDYLQSLKSMVTLQRKDTIVEFKSLRGFYHIQPNP